MFDRFTDDAKRALSLARRAALRFGHDYIGTEHMLLGLCATAENPACRILRDLGAEPQSVCDALEPRIPPGSSPDADVLPFAPRAKLALEQAMFGASEHGYRWIDPSHLLLGVVRVTDGLAARVLAELGVTADAVNEGVRAQRPDDAQVVDDVVAARFADSEPERGAARLVLYAARVGGDDRVGSPADARRIPRPPRAPRLARLGRRSLARGDRRRSGHRTPATGGTARRVRRLMRGCGGAGATIRTEP